MANVTASFDLPPLPIYELKPLPPLVPWLPDECLTLALPVAAYWLVSLFFHVIDEWDLFPHYRLHTPAEVLKRNRVTRFDVLKDVILQQVIQTVVGYGLTAFDPPATYGSAGYDVAWWAQTVRLAQRAIPAVLATMGLDAKAIAGRMVHSHPTWAGVISGGVYPNITQTIIFMGEPTSVPAFAEWEQLVAKAIYHVGIPAMQFLLAIMIVDTWQYFLHRAMHMNKWLYTTFHSRHHRLYVPYAYGALYNHPFEGFLLDTLGTGIAYLISGMTVRQSMWFFTMSTIKTVDDHCGYSFPWDPLQHVTSNNAGYHDVHHQSWGIKTNFSQPFFTFWDGFLGTKWTGGDVSARYERARNAAQKKVDAEAASSAVTGSPPSDSKKVRSGDAYENDAAEAPSAVRATQKVAEPRIPSGKATNQAIGSRQQVLDDTTNGGLGVLVDETWEEIKAQQTLRSSTRTRAKSSGLKGFADRVGESLQGKGTGVLGVESRSR